MSHGALGDPVGGLTAALQFWSPVIHARGSGRGQFIDLAQIECMMPFAAPWITFNSIDGMPQTRYAIDIRSRAAPLLPMCRTGQLYHRSRDRRGCGTRLPSLLAGQTGPRTHR